VTYAGNHYTFYNLSYRAWVLVSPIRFLCVFGAFLTAGAPMWVRLCRFPLSLGFLIEVYISPEYQNRFDHRESLHCIIPRTLHFISSCFQIDLASYSSLSMSSSYIVQELSLPSSFPPASHSYLTLPVWASAIQLSFEVIPASLNSQIHITSPQSSL
jgi:hypothetical protein